MCASRASSTSRPSFRTSSAVIPAPWRSLASRMLPPTTASSPKLPVAASPERFSPGRSRCRVLRCASAMYMSCSVCSRNFASCTSSVALSITHEKACAGKNDHVFSWFPVSCSGPPSEGERPCFLLPLSFSSRSRAIASWSKSKCRNSTESVMIPSPWSLFDEAVLPSRPVVFIIPFVLFRFLSSYCAAPTPLLSRFKIFRVIISTTTSQLSTAVMFLYPSAYIWKGNSELPLPSSRISRWSLEPGSSMGVEPDVASAMPRRRPKAAERIGFSRW
mmetsp:Transcript_5731/g.14284  ORF Transcript_5731/g.14284 Transcript_5731/m.14284 type:complete len:275 (-) Transcript_5731:268-1092(-)